MSGLGDTIIRFFLVHKLRDIAEGKMGETLKKVYWFLAGKKRLTGLLLAFIAGGLHATGHGTIWLDLLSAALIQVGLLDVAWRAEPPKK